MNMVCENNGHNIIKISRKLKNGKIGKEHTYRYITTGIMNKTIPTIDKATAIAINR